MTEILKRTALYDWYTSHGGRMVPFAGYEMPVQYPTGPILELEVTRSVAGLFDIDHMGQMEVPVPAEPAGQRPAPVRYSGGESPAHPISRIGRAAVGFDQRSNL